MRRLFEQNPSSQKAKRAEDWNASPISWGIVNFGLFGPESLMTYFITILGLAYFVAKFREIRNAEKDLMLKDMRRWLIFVLLTTVYLVLPLIMLHLPWAADNHYAKTLRDIENRQGRYFEIDRRPYALRDGQGVIRTFANEEIKLEGIPLKRSAQLSVKARFIDRGTAVAIDYHEHSSWFRDFASYLGLGLVAFSWSLSVHRGRESCQAAKS